MDTKQQLADAFYDTLVFIMGLTANLNDYSQYFKYWPDFGDQHYVHFIAYFVSKLDYRILLIEEVENFVYVYGRTGPIIPIRRTKTGFQSYNNKEEIEKVLTYPMLVEALGSPTLSDIIALYNEQCLLDY